MIGAEKPQKFIYFDRGGLTTHWAPGQQGIMGPLCPCPNSKKPMKKVPGASHGAPY
ncbi:unnamed protein product [Staurois parvus]|uniref:Uncharacterized protein n=1 Tax=Staurois parvus TaxID=386267 RepID=A0ABN9B773_9NEOB|nr:unnamed protein product [Staurois parvus]